MKSPGPAAPDTGQRANHSVQPATAGSRSAIEIAPKGRSAGRPPAWTRRDAAFLFILLLAAFVRSIGLNRGLWLDEIANVGVLTRPAIAALFNVEITTARSPLFFALYRPWLALAGDSAVAARWPALLCGVLSVALIWRVARAWAGPRAGYAAALLLALSPLHIWYSQEASFYTFVGALALGVVCLSSPPAPLLSAVRRGEGGTRADLARPVRRWLLLALSLALLLAASLWTVFFVAALGLWVLIWQRERGRFFLTALALALLLSAPALAVYLAGAAAGWSTPITRPGLPLAQLAYSLLTLGWGFAAGPPPEALRQALATGAGLRDLLRQHLGWLFLAASPWIILPLLAYRARLPRFSISPLRSPISPLQSPVSNLCSPSSDLQSPSSDPQSPSSDLRSPSSGLQSPSSGLQSPSSGLQSPSSGLQSPASNLRSPSSDLQSPVSPLRSPLSTPPFSPSPPLSLSPSPPLSLSPSPPLPFSPSPLSALLLLWLTIPLLGANLLTWWAQTNFNVRYVLFALPALLLWLAVQDRRLVGMAVALSAVFWLRGVSDPAFAQEDLQRPAQFLQSAVQPADVLLLRAPEVYLLAPLAFYGTPPGAIAWYNGDTAQRQTPAVFVAQQAAGHCRIWLWSARAWLVDRDDALTAGLAAFATPVMTWRWPGSELTLFQRAPCP